MSKSSHQLPAGLLQPLPTPQRPWSHIAIDFVTDLPPSRGHTTILSVIDRFSKACRLIPLPKLPTALETANPYVIMYSDSMAAGGYSLGSGTPVHLPRLSVCLLSET